MAWDTEQARLSEAKAEKEFTEMINNLSEAEREGVRKLATWWRRWYNGNGEDHATGHKALARIFVKHTNNSHS